VAGDKTMFQAKDEKRIESLCHLFGPAAVVGACCLLVVAALLAWPPKHFPKYVVDSTDIPTLKGLLDLRLNDYKAGLVAFNTNISAQALLVVMAVLVIIRRSDSLNFFGNSIPRIPSRTTLAARACCKCSSHAIISRPCGP
jgi:hypothetical protein